MGFNNHLKKTVWSTRIDRIMPIWIFFYLVRSFIEYQYCSVNRNGSESHDKSNFLKTAEVTPDTPQPCILRCTVEHDDIGTDIDVQSGHHSIISVFRLNTKLEIIDRSFLVEPILVSKLGIHIFSVNGCILTWTRNSEIQRLSCSCQDTNVDRKNIHLTVSYILQGGWTPVHDTSTPRFRL